MVWEDGGRKAPSYPICPGSKIWLTAFFFNPRAMSGPAATPVSTYLPGGAAMAA